MEARRDARRGPGADHGRRRSLQGVQRPLRPCRRRHLRARGEILGRAVRTHLDLAARYGGEEFAILLPSMEADDAFKLGEQLRADVAACCMRHAKAPCGFVTVSAGVATLRPGSGDTAKTLVEAADAALYAAKRRGRNTVVAHEPMMRLAS